jgi:1-aminocyclopropane-1-carboxylate deaminase
MCCVFGDIKMTAFNPPSFFTDTFLTQTRLQRLQGAPWNHRGIRVFIKREDERDNASGGQLGGNKWCKLMGYLALAQEQGITRLVSMGGLWSNHLHALAFAGKRFGFETTGIVRGESAQLTPALRDAQAAGMQLEFVSRETYRSRHDNEWQQFFAQKFGPCLMIPEGGAGQPSLAGLALLAKEITEQSIKLSAAENAQYPVLSPVVLALPVGSGTTLMGLCQYLPGDMNVWGFQAFTDATLSTRIHAALPAVPVSSCSLFHTEAMKAHHKLSPSLLSFMRAFEQNESIALDPVYTVRMMSRLQTMIETGEVADNTTVLAVHTGGLQGRRGHDMTLAA